MTAFDPILHLLPVHMVEEVLLQPDCDIDHEFLGFTSIYQALASIIPTHWTVVDLGCAYAPQSFLFREHKKYIGVDMHGKIRFSAPNTEHFNMPIADFISQHGHQFSQDTTFAICSYVPPWSADNMELTRRHFKNVFTYYPASSGDQALPVKFSARERKVNE